MDRDQVLDAVRSLVERGTFAVLAVLTAQGDVVLRPIGGRWGSGIRDAVEEAAGKYPGCRMQLFERACDYERYFEGIVPKEQVLPYAACPPEAKAALEELRRRVLDPSRKEFWQELGSEPFHFLRPQVNEEP